MKSDVSLTQLQFPAWNVQSSIFLNAREVKEETASMLGAPSPFIVSTFLSPFLSIAHLWVLPFGVLYCIFCVSSVRLLKPQRHSLCWAHASLEHETPAQAGLGHSGCCKPFVACQAQLFSQFLPVSPISTFRSTTACGMLGIMEAKQNRWCSNKFCGLK